MTSPFIGRRIEVGIAKESSRGVGVAPTYWIRKAALDFIEKVDKIKSDMGVGHIAQHITSVKTDQWAEGTIEGEIRDKMFGLLLTAAMGATSTPSAYATTAFQHAWTLTNTNLHQSLCIGYKDPIGDLMFELAMLNSLKVDITAGDLARFTADFMSKYPVDSVLTASYDADENLFRGRDLQVKIAANQAALDAATAISVKSLTFTIAKNLTRDNVCGTLGAENIFNTVFSITGQMVLNFTDLTYRNYLLNNNTKALRIRLTNADVPIGDGTGNPIFTLDLRKVGFEEWTRDAGLDDIVSQTISFEAFYDPATGGMIDALTLNNEVASY